MQLHKFINLRTLRRSPKPQGKGVNMKVILRASGYLKKRLFLCQRGQSTLEYAMVTVIAIVISAVLIAVGKPYIIEIVSNVFEKISGMV